MHKWFAAPTSLAVTFLSLALGVPSMAPAAEADEMAELKRSVEALRAENRKLARRLATLEAERAAREKEAKAERDRAARAAREKAAQARREQVAPVERDKAVQPEPAAVAQDKTIQAEQVKAAQAERLKAAQQRAAQQRAVLAEEENAAQEKVARAEAAARSKQEQLEQRVTELELSRTAQEEATRAIVRDSVSTLGSKINEYVALGGVLEVAGGWAKEFSGESNGVIQLTTAQFDFEIQVNEWTLGSVIVEWLPATNVIFPTTNSFQTVGDRLTIDTASITVGNPLKFPPFATAGQIVLPFGISTGNPVTDVLSLENPLTVEAFEMRNVAVGFGVGFPTPAVTPATPAVPVTPVKPQVINPLISSLSGRLGYNPPPQRPKPPTLYTAPAKLPPFNAGVFFYQGQTSGGPGQHIDATVGYRTGGHCGRPYYQLVGSKFCPWTLQVDVDYNSSVFDSRFMSTEYLAFLGQIGLVPGMAASVKSTLGPLSLVGEWNGAIQSATFFDDLGNRVSITPTAWQLSLGYQFDWNPWVETIGAQGTYIALGYSQSSGLAGVTQLIDGVPTRVGFVPRQRLLLTAGEWVLEGLRFAAEYSYNWDYPVSEGGTGNAAQGFFVTLTYTW